MSDNGIVYHEINETPMDRVSHSPDKVYLPLKPADAQKFIFPENARLCGCGFLQILFVSSGNGTVKLNGTEYSLKPGLFLIPDQGIALELFPTAPVILYSCSFLPELFDCTPSSACSLSDLSDDRLLSFFFRNTEITFPAVKVPAIHIETFRGIYNQMIRLTDDPTPAYSDLMRLYIAELLIRLSEALSPAAVQEDADDARMIRLVTDHIRSNCAAKHTYDSLAKAVCVSRSKLFAAFKKMTGKSIGDYIKMVRINQACALLSETEKSVYDIMLDVGYNDMKMFCRRFRECTGMTPTEYRKQYRA